MKTSLHLGSLGLLSKAAAANALVAKPFTVNLSSRVPHMLDLIQRTVLPAAELPAANANLNMSLTTGIPLSTLKNTTTLRYKSELKVNTIGLALYDNPVGQLAWLAEKFVICTGPSFMTDNEILRHVSLYYLTQTFDSAAFVYAQNPDGFSHTYRTARSKQPLLYTNFRYNILFYPEKLVATIGNLVYYNKVQFGGHFPGVDNPAALASDIRLSGKYFKA
ncbi:hypothetical protein J3F84DRAFT_402106 [Trichoderma pleuroticola]